MAKCLFNQPINQSDGHKLCSLGRHLKTNISDIQYRKEHLQVIKFAQRQIHRFLRMSLSQSAAVGRLVRGTRHRLRTVCDSL